MLAIPVLIHSCPVFMRDLKYGENEKTKVAVTGLRYTKKQSFDCSGCIVAWSGVSGIVHHWNDSSHPCSYTPVVVTFPFHITEYCWRNN